MFVEVELKEKPEKVSWFRHDTLLKPGDARDEMSYNKQTGAFRF